MGNNTKKTGGGLASLAAKTLNNPSASAIQKSLAASALSQTSSSNQTGAAMEHKASTALKNPNSSALTKQLAATVLSQSNKDRK